MRSLLSERSLILFSVLVISLVFFPYVYLGEDVHIRHHDNLDSNIVWVKIILDAGGGFFMSPSSIVEQIMNGVPHSCVWGTYDLSLLIFDIFGIFWGYVVNKFLVAILGFFGMYLVLKKYFVKDETPHFIIIGVAVLFSLLPFWSFAASISGLPIALYAFLNLRNRDTSLSNWVILFIYGFYSSLVLVGVFFLIGLSILFLRDFVKTKKINYHFIGGIIFLSVTYLISHFPLVWSFFYDTNFVSQRVELKTGQSSFFFTFRRLLTSGDQTFGSNHAVSLQRYVLIPISSIAFFFMLVKRSFDFKFIYLSLAIVITSFLFAYIGWDYELKERLMLLLPIDLRRFNWLQPLFWYLLFGVSLSYLYLKVKNKSVATVLILLAFLFQFVYEVYYQEYNLYKTYDYSFKKYYAEAQFDEIAQFIGKDKKDYRVISVGLEPAISQFNGFYTLDGYFPNYPLEYKHQFAKVVNPELEKKMGLYYFFHEWGSKCYAFSTELDYPMEYLISGPSTIAHLDFNYAALKEMGGEYIISSREIDLDNNKDIQLMNIFNHKDSYRIIYLYEVL